jgi:hypothetical protein
MQPDAAVNSPELSEALRQAQARLLQLRAERGIEAKASAIPPWETAEDATDAPNWPLLNAQKELQRRRATVSRSATNPTCVPADPPPSLTAEPEVISSTVCTTKNITVHPTILLAMLKQRQEAPGRVWLLLRAIDCDGRGWLTVEEARRQLTDNDSPLHICGWRRLRQLLAQGEGTFWHRDEQDRLWLKGGHRIAHRLDSGRLQGFPIELPIERLLGGIQEVRAAFYASFHGGRDSKPISRDTIESLSGIPGRTQLEYDRVARVQRTGNIAIGERHTTENAQERAWRHGRAAFHFIDTEGRQGRAGREYVAWRLPNSYHADYQRRSRGSRKRLNRKLADLVRKGIPGNDDRAVEKLFFPNGALAAKRYNRNPEHDAYWQQKESTRTGGKLWHVISGKRR